MTANGRKQPPIQSYTQWLVLTQSGRSRKHAEIALVPVFDLDLGVHDYVWT
jgi:hypothetical protein